LQFLFEGCFDVAARIGHKSILEGLEYRTPQLCACEQLGGASRLFSANSISAENDPVKLRLRILSYQAQYGAATTYLDVVAMRTETQNLECTPGFPIEVKVNHMLTEIRSESLDGAATWFQTFHGAAPWFNSSRCCLSLKVSMHCQKPVYLYAKSAF